MPQSKLRISLAERDLPAVFREFAAAEFARHRNLDAAQGKRIAAGKPSFDFNSAYSFSFATTTNKNARQLLAASSGNSLTVVPGILYTIRARQNSQPFQAQNTERMRICSRFSRETPSCPRNCLRGVITDRPCAVAKSPVSSFQSVFIRRVIKRRNTRTNRRCSVS